MKYTYKGVVLTSGSIFYLFIRKTNRDITDGLPISNTKGVYDKLTRNHIQLVNVELLDGIGLCITKQTKI